MDIKDAARTANQFIDQYLADNHFFTPDEDLANEKAGDRECHVLSYFGATPKGPATLHLIFFYGQNVDTNTHDPEKCAKKTILALKKALPKIAQLTLEYEVTRQY
jgi:hypothetical protein